MADDVVSEPSLCELKMDTTDQTDTNLLALPPEIIRAVLVLPALSMRDVSSLGQTCQKMNALVNDDCNDVWRTKHRQRWSDAHEVLLGSVSEMDWQAECKRALQVFHLTAKLLDEVWPKMYFESEVCYSLFSPLQKIMQEDKTAYYYIKDFLSDGNVGANLTRKYQSKRVLRYVRQEYLTELWNKFKALPAEEQLLEVGVSYVAEWSQPLLDLSPDQSGKHLDAIADSVLEKLAVSDPDHPIFTIPVNERRKWGKKCLPSDMWDYKHCMIILHAMDHVLIEGLGFNGNKENYHHRQNYLFDKVLSLRQGIPLTLNTIVESVARRLGIRTELCYRGHFVLKWKSDKDTDMDHVYLDLFTFNHLIHPRSYMRNPAGSGGCPYQGIQYPIGPATTMEIIERLTTGIEVTGRMCMRNNGHSTHLRSALELMFVVNPTNLTYVLHLARLYMLHNISVSKLIDGVTSTMEVLPIEMHQHAQNIVQMFKNYLPDPEAKPPPVPQTRLSTPKVTFAVGMSMFHKKYNYLCVITGWDAKCTATDAWKQEMGVQWLKYKDDQPFYNVLVPDGTTRYAAQENLEPLKAKDSLNTFNAHPDVGRYFESYQNGYYVPNSLKMVEYPNDMNVCRQFYDEGKK